MPCASGGLGKGISHRPVFFFMNACRFQTPSYSFLFVYNLLGELANLCTSRGRILNYVRRLGPLSDICVGLLFGPSLMPLRPYTFCSCCFFLFYNPINIVFCYVISRWLYKEATVEDTRPDDTDSEKLLVHVIMTDAAYAKFQSLFASKTKS